MKERPILFSGEMVRAILDGRKTQTRRMVKPQLSGDELVMNRDGSIDGYRDAGTRAYNPACYWRPMRPPVRCPYGQRGDRLWVKETWGTRYDFDVLKPTLLLDPRETKLGAEIYRAADYGAKPALVTKWRPAIFMRRWMSRITLEITAVRVERLQDISRGDAMEEGCPFANMANGDDPRRWYAELWRSINGPDSWEKNPWVWVIEFRRLAQ